MHFKYLSVSLKRPQLQKPDMPFGGGTPSTMNVYRFQEGNSKVALLVGGRNPSC